jgi:uncharacterized protein (TIGR02147 family)
MPSTPNLFEYLDYRKFLRDWFVAKKELNRRFSHRAFARRAGQRSPSTLSDVMEGRRNLTQSTTESFCKALAFTAEENSFFTLLVHLDQAKNTDERNRAYETIAATRRFKEARRIEGEGFRYLTHWYYPAIRELAQCPSFRNDPKWISDTLCPSITPSQAKRAVAELLDMGLLEEHDGSLRPTDATIVTPHEVRGLAANNYHQGNLSLAKKAINTFRPSERHFCGVTAAIPASLIPELKKEMNHIQERLLEFCNRPNEDDETVIQLNLHFFPLSQTIKETS